MVSKCRLWTRFGRFVGTFTQPRVAYRLVLLPTRATRSNDFIMADEEIGGPKLPSISQLQLQRRRSFFRLV